jgi:hypothetical protein
MAPWAPASDAAETMKERAMQFEADEVVSGKLSESALAAMVEHGIKRVRVDHFIYGGFRYTNLDDAIAEANRHPNQP